MLKINTVTMEEKIFEILFKTILTNTEIDQCTKELLDLFSVNKRAFNVTYLGNDEIIKGLTVLADSKEEAMHKALLLRDSKDIYSAIEVNVC